MKQKWVEAFIDTAERFAQLSSAVKLKVGAVIVKDNRIISIGYNGTPSGWNNNCEHWEKAPFKENAMQYQDDGYQWVELDGEHVWAKLMTNDHVIHAEANAIAKLASSTESGKNSVMFCTHAPCIHCAKQIYGAGINKVYYKNTYRSVDGIIFLQRCGVQIEKV